MSYSRSSVGQMASLMQEGKISVIALVSITFIVCNPREDKCIISPIVHILNLQKKN